MIGAAAMSLSSLCVVTNALRLRFFKPRALKGAENKAETPQSKNFTAEKQIITAKGETYMKKVLTVEGMMCAHCQAHVQKALEGVEGVKQAEVDLEKKRAFVTLIKEVSNEALTAAVEEAGYTVANCEAV